MKHYRDNDWRGHTALTPLEFKDESGGNRQDGRVHRRAQKGER